MLYTCVVAAASCSELYICIKKYEQRKSAHRY